MDKYEQQIDYSMPRQCGLYPPPPYIYHNMRAILAVVQCKPGVKEKFLPPEFEPVEYGLDIVFITEYPESSLGPYNESLIMLYCSYKGNPGAFVFNIYVDSEEALTAGREIYGYPKKMCDIKLSPIQDNKVRGTLTRKGITFLDIEVELKKRAPGMNPSDMIANMPLYNLKLIPDVADNSKPVLRQLTETVLSWNVHKQVGADINYLTTKYSKFDICHEVLKDTSINRGAFYVECDQTLPNGRLLE
ncbi:MAG: acetoacetate decarboxylase family protein [Candidatus Helarchaeota archaeon]